LGLAINFEAVRAVGTRVNLKDRNPFTQQVVRRTLLRSTTCENGTIPDASWHITYAYATNFSVKTSCPNSDDHAGRIVIYESEIPSFSVVAVLVITSPAEMFSSKTVRLLWTFCLLQLPSIQYAWVEQRAVVHRV